MPVSTPTIIIQVYLTNISSRKLLLHNPLYNSPPLAISPTNTYSESSTRNNNIINANVVMVLSVLLCALICSLGLNSIIRCALRCSSLVSSDPTGTGPSSARLGKVGVKKKALKTFPTVSYTNDLKMATECAICLSEFILGERLRVLPKCNHGFHVRCIDKWLNSHSSCPTCRHSLIVESSAATTSLVIPVTPPPPIHQVVLRIEPLQPEGLIRMQS